MNRNSRSPYILALLTALALSACNSDSGTTQSDPPSGGGTPSGINIVITAPSTSPVIDTIDPRMNLEGTASSSAGISAVTWKNSKGGSGTATGTTSWRISDMNLALGENVITITAKSNSGTSIGRQVTINRESGQLSSVTISWHPPTARTDGSPLNNLAGYRIYYGRMSGIYDYHDKITNPGLATYVVENLVAGRWYFAVAAYDSDGVQSHLSQQVSTQTH